MLSTHREIRIAKRSDSFDLKTNEKCGFFIAGDATVVIMPLRE
ncbi:MAG: hypothetical protein WC762_02985 [Methylobacter sp.]